MEKQVATEQEEIRFSRGFFYTLRRVFRHKQGLAGSLLVFFMVFIAIAAPFLAPHDPYKRNIKNMLLPPSGEHWFGTDIQGRDYFSQVLYGARITLLSSVAAVFISMVIGVFVGVFSGYFGGKLDLIVGAVIDFLLSFPTLILALIIVSILGPGLRNAVFAVGIQGIPIFTRFVRGEVLVQKEVGYVEGSIALGVSSGRILWKHIVPNIIPSIITLITLELPRVILMLAGLGFIGLGAQPPVLEWGRLMVSARDFFVMAPWLINFPGLAIMLSVFGFNLLGNALRDIFDPSLN